MTTTITAAQGSNAGRMDRSFGGRQPGTMTVLSRDLDIALPADVVWETLIDVGSWPQWMAHVADARWLEGETPGPGARLQFTMQHLQSAPTVQAEITSFRPGKELAYSPVAGDTPFTEGMKNLEWEWRIWGRPTGNCTLSFTLTYTAAGGAAFFRELLGTRLQVLNLADSSLKALQAMAEGRVPSSEPAEA